jgi:hypothetical protein
LHRRGKLNDSLHTCQLEKVKSLDNINHGLEEFPSIDGGCVNRNNYFRKSRDMAQVVEHSVSSNLRTVKGEKRYNYFGQ